MPVLPPITLAQFQPGREVRQTGYSSFVPEMVNREWTWDDPRIHTLLEEATRALGELNAFSIIVPDIDLFIQLHIVKEANSSSRIEGTRTEMEEALLPEEEVALEKRDDWHEVHNYVRAMREAIASLAQLPLSTRLLKQTHRTLMQGVRGEHKLPGEYRRSQNWIGGASLQDAFFIPPPHGDVDRLMGDLENFWHNDAVRIPHLVRIGISHYQFETIHPFLDGNGRIGRLLITLYLMGHGLLKKPSLYLSSYIELHRGAYYEALSIVRTTGDMGHWLRFFLLAIRETALKGRDTFEAILSLRRRVDNQVLALGPRAGKARSLLALLYRQPHVGANDVADHLNVSHRTAVKLIGDFERLGFLRETTGYQRNRRYRFDEYLDLFLH